MWASVSLLNPFLNSCSTSCFKCTYSKKLINCISFLFPCLLSVPSHLRNQSPTLVLCCVVFWWLSEPSCFEGTYHTGTYYNVSLAFICFVCHSLDIIIVSFLIFFCVDRHLLNQLPVIIKRLLNFVMVTLLFIF